MYKKKKTVFCYILIRMPICLFFWVIHCKHGCPLIFVLNPLYFGFVCLSATAEEKVESQEDTISTMESVEVTLFINLMP